MHMEVADVLAGLIEAMPEDVLLDEPETVSARTARERRDAAERKRTERARRRSEGMPDPRAVDSAIATALADINRRARFRARAKAQKSFDGMAITLEAILGQCIEELVVRRGVAMPQARAAIKQRLGLARRT